MRIVRFTLVAGVLAFGDGCAGSATEARTGNDRSVDGRATKDVVQLRANFLLGCSKGHPQDHDYCACSWEVTSRELTPAELTSIGLSRERQQQVAAKAARTCTDDRVRKAFVRDCAQSREEYIEYCECVYLDLRKALTDADLATDDVLRSPKFADVSQSAANACTKDVPEPLVKNGFINGCIAKSDDRPFCECAWQQLRMDMSPSDIARPDSPTTPIFKDVQGRIERNCRRGL